MSVQRHLVLANIIDVNHSAVTYPGCTQCYTKLLVDTTTQRYQCIKCGASVPSQSVQWRYQCTKCGASVPSQSVQWRYRLVLTVADDTAVCQVVVFGKTLDPLFGKSATDFYRSFTGLEKSGYPAEELLEDALMKTFHGKYFYLGLKLHQSKPVKGRVPTLSDFCVQQSAGTANQSVLNHTDATDQPHILVYQIVATNDGVYATVSDHIRLSIKHLRNGGQGRDACQTDTNCTGNQSTKSDDSSWRDRSDLSVRNNNSTLYKTRLFQLRQESIAFSFNSSVETSSEYSNLVNNLTGNKSGGCGTDKVCDGSIDHTSHILIHHDCSDTELSAAGHGHSHKVCVTEESNTDSVKVHVLDPRERSPHTESVIQKLNFSNISDSSYVCGANGSINEGLTGNKLIPADKHDDSDILYLPDSEALEAFLDTDGEITEDRTEISEVVKHKDVGGVCLPVSRELESLLETFSMSVTTDRRSDNRVCNVTSSVNQFQSIVTENLKVVEDFMEMPDSEGLETFLAGADQDQLDEANILPYNQTLDEVAVKENNTVKVAYRQDNTPQPEPIKDTNSDTDGEPNAFCLPDSEDLEAFLASEDEIPKDPVQLKETMKHKDGANEMYLPESEELEAFLETFNEAWSFTDKTEEDSAMDEPSKRTSGSSKNEYENKYVEIVSENQNSCRNDNSVTNKINLLVVNENSFINETLPSDNKGISKSYKIGTIVNQDRDTNHIVSVSDNRDDGNKFSILKKCLPIYDSTVTKTDYQNHSTTESSTDSGLQLSTSSIDLFLSPESEHCGNNSISGNCLCSSKASDLQLMTSCRSEAFVEQRHVNSVTVADFGNGNKERLDIDSCEDIDHIDSSGITDDAFEDSWSELLLDELAVSVCEPTKHCVGPVLTCSSKTPQNNVTIKTTDQIDHFKENETSMVDKENDVKSDICEESTNQNYNNSESGFDSSDILFDSPEASSSLQKNLFISLSFEKQSHIQTAADNVATCSTIDGDNKVDGEVIPESQSSYPESETPSDHSHSDDVQIPGNLGGIIKSRKVMFSKRLRRVSSVRLMDIKMKENKHPSNRESVVQKSCLKPYYRTNAENEVNSITNQKLTTDMGQLNCDTFKEDSFTCNNDSFFIESSQPTDNQIKDQYLHKSTAYCETVNKPSSQCEIEKDNPHCSAKTLYLQLVTSCRYEGLAEQGPNDIPCTPDLWGDSFDETNIDVTSCNNLNKALTSDTAIMDDSFDETNHDVTAGNNLNRALIFDTPITDGSFAVSNAFTCNTKRIDNDRSILCKSVANVQENTPDIFTQRMESPMTSGRAQKENMLPEETCENECNTSNAFEPVNTRERVIPKYGHKNKSKKCHVNQPAKTEEREVFKCIVSNTPGCEKSVMTKHLTEEDNGGSPDLFSDDPICDTEFNNLHNVPSVLCKQLFF